jgi:hypothetical protein
LVDFEGKTQLEIETSGNLFTSDFGELANRMVDEQIVKNIKDQSIVDWLLPGFTTTTPKDRVVASVSIMSAFQNFFDYKLMRLCGIPEVTLLGTVEDWQLLRGKVDRLLEFEVSGQNYMTKWHGWLSTICDNLIASASGSDTIEFWDHVVSHIGRGSAIHYLSGWLSTFTVFNSKGEWLENNEELKQTIEIGSEEVFYPIINDMIMAAGYSVVPVLFDDNGVKYDCQMFTGQISFDVTGDGDTIVPRSDWCIATIKDP